MSQSEPSPPSVLNVSLPADGHPDGAAEDGTPSVLDALGDAACRAILREVNDPMTAKEIAGITGLPLSTTYRKLDFLSDTYLLREQTELRPDGNHRSRYQPDFEAVRIVVDKRRNIDVSISRPVAGDDE